MSIETEQRTALNDQIMKLQKLRQATSQRNLPNKVTLISKVISESTLSPRNEVENFTSSLNPSSHVDGINDTNGQSVLESQEIGDDSSVDLGANVTTHSFYRHGNSVTLFDKYGNVLFPVFADLILSDHVFKSLSLSARGLVIQLSLALGTRVLSEKLYEVDEAGNFVRQSWDSFMARLCKVLNLREFEANAAMVELVSQEYVDLGEILDGPIPGSIAPRGL